MPPIHPLCSFVECMIRLSPAYLLGRAIRADIAENWLTDDMSPNVYECQCHNLQSTEMKKQMVSEIALKPAGKLFRINSKKGCQKG